jgi:hypothetical protein
MSESSYPGEILLTQILTLNVAPSAKVLVLSASGP